jgi:glycosyltransferase involved in cell wall biosynthesis
MHYLPKPIPKRFGLAVMKRFLVWYYQGIDQIMTPSQIGADLLRKYGVTKPITVVRNPVLPFPEISKAEARQHLQLPKDEFILLYVGRLAKEKNVPLLLEAIPIVLREFPNTHLWILGDGPDRPELEAACQQQGLSSRIHFTGTIARDLVGYYMVASDLFTFPSITESQGLGMDEAQAAGLPCVVTTGGGAPEAVQHGITGLVAEPELEPFSNAVLTLLRDPDLREQFSRNGLLKRETLSIPAVTDRLLDIYQKAINRNWQGSGVRDQESGVKV